MSDVQPEPIQWLWPSRIAMRKITLLVGDPGLGKSTVTLDIAARTSTGSAWPDGAKIGPPAGVVIISAEDDPADTIRPRLDAAGADVDRIVMVSAVEYSANGGKHERSFSLADVPALESAIDQTPDCRLVIIDPVTAFLGATDSHKNAEVRTMLSPIGELARRAGVAVLIVSHLNKAAGGSAIYRASGSLAFAAAARAVWLVVKQPHDLTNSVRLMLPVKNNIGNDRTGLAYTLRNNAGSEQPFVIWKADPVTTTADEALTPERGRPGPDPKATTEAADYLREALANGPRLAKELYSEASDSVGISETTLKRAKKDLGVIAYRDTIPGPWQWRLPTDGGESDPEHLDPLGTLAELPGDSNGFEPVGSKGAKMSDELGVA